MKAPFAIIKNEDVFKKGEVKLEFLPYMRYDSPTGVKVYVEVASCGSSGSMLSFITKDSDEDVVNSNFQFVPGMYPMYDKEKNQVRLYDETSVNAKGIYQMASDGDIEYPQFAEKAPEPTDEEEASDEAIQRAFDGTGVDPLEEEDEDTEEDFDDEEEDDEDTEENIDDDSDNFKAVLNRINAEEAEEAIKEGTDDLTRDEVAEMDDEDAEEEKSRSVDEIREIVKKKKNFRRENISYVGVKESALPTENGPMRAENFDTQQSISEQLKTIEKVEDHREQDEMKSRFENERKSRYDRKREFNNRKYDQHNNQEKNFKKDNRKGRQNQRAKLDMNDLDSIIGSMQLKSED